MNQQAFTKVDKATFYQFVQKHDEQRFEYEDGYIVQQMTGGTRAHARLALKLATKISEQLDKTQWTALMERGVDAPAAIRYPDVVVEPATEPPESLSTEVPALIIEVLSSSSIARDLERKPTEYLAIQSLRAYAVFSQFTAAAQIWTRSSDGQFPAEPTNLTAPTDRITIPTLDLNFSIADIYDGIDLPKQD